MLPLVLSAVFGFVKGLTSSGGASNEEAFSLEMDLYGPVKEELIYRGAPLWLKPDLPFGSTAVLFAGEHILSDARNDGLPADAWQVAARFCDVFAGGCLYELAHRRHGILGAIASHSAHNVFVGIGSRVRR